jgi:class 3 adenylate cyclase
VEKFIDDAVMAVFGAPIAHEDDAERAVRAALCVVDAIAELVGKTRLTWEFSDSSTTSRPRTLAPGPVLAVRGRHPRSGRSARS